MQQYFVCQCDIMQLDRENIQYIPIIKKKVFCCQMNMMMKIICYNNIAYTFMYILQVYAVIYLQCGQKSFQLGYERCSMYTRRCMQMYLNLYYIIIQFIYSVSLKNIRDITIIAYTYITHTQTLYTFIDKCVMFIRNVYT